MAFKGNLNNPQPPKTLKHPFEDEDLSMFEFPLPPVTMQDLEERQLKDNRAIHMCIDMVDHLHEELQQVKQRITNLENK